MPKKEWVASYEGHEIKVSNTWLGGSKLFIDGNCVDTADDLSAISKAPTLNGSIEKPDNTSIRIAVYMKSTAFKIKAKICADGQKIGGDSF
jgi:hypothetical protein